MIKANDIVSLDVDEKWITSGINYALISWTSTFNRMGKPNPYSRIEKIVLGIIAEAALENYFNNLSIDFETHGKTKWYEEDRYDIGLKGYAIDVKSNFLDLSSQYIIKKLTNIFDDKLNWFLKCHALVPLDQFNPGTNERRAHKRDKVYIFPFIEGYFNEQKTSTTLVHAFWDYKWLKRAEYKDLANLGNVAIEYSGTQKGASIKIYGTTAKNEACIEYFDFSKNQSETTNDFFQIFSIEWTGKNNPDGVIKIKAKKLKLIEIINPKCSFELEKTEDGYWPIHNDWQSMKLYNSKVHLLGWIYEEDFRIIGAEQKRFTKTIEQYSEIKVDNWGCLINELEPMKAIKNIK
jgi:hypothetical protein